MPDEPTVPEEATQDRHRRRPVLLALLAAGAILVALAGSGALAGGGASAGAGDGSTPVQGKPAADERLRQGEPGAGMTHRGRHCNHDGRNRTDPQSAPPESPPV